MVDFEGDRDPTTSNESRSIPKETSTSNEDWAPILRSATDATRSVVNTTKPTVNRTNLIFPASNTWKAVQPVSKSPIPNGTDTTNSSHSIETATQTEHPIQSVVDTTKPINSTENTTKPIRSAANTTKPIVNATNQIFPAANASKPVQPVSKSPIPNGTDTTDSDLSMEPATQTERPLLVLHVGPGKTGTTSIQSTLKNETEALKSDKYTYIGNNAGPLDKTQSYHCENHEEKKGCKRVLGEDMMYLLKAYQKSYNHTLLGSNEFIYNLSDDKRKAWVDATQTLYQWNVKIVVSYRRLHEYLPSLYNQHYKKNRLPTEPKLYGHHNWPGIDGNYKLPTFPEYLESKVDLTQHDTFSTYESWGKDFPVSVFNVHQEGDLTTNFVCQIVPSAKTLCDELTRRFAAQNEGKHSNIAKVVFDYDIMGVTAWEKGLIHPERDSRNNLRKEIRKHHQEVLNSTELPQVCPNATMLEKFRESSWKHEQWAESFAPKPVSSFAESWEHMLPKFCTVDAEAALELPEWKTFFEKRYKRKAAIHEKQKAKPAADR